MDKQQVYVVIFPCPEATFGEIELAIAGIFLDLASAEVRLAECVKEHNELIENDEDIDMPYIITRDLG